MRIDKYLKISRLIKRRAIAKQLADSGYVFIGGKKAKPSDEVKVGDELRLVLGRRETRARVLSIAEHKGKADAAPMYEILEGEAL